MAHLYVIVDLEAQHCPGNWGD